MKGVFFRFQMSSIGIMTTRNVFSKEIQWYFFRPEVCAKIERTKATVNLISSLLFKQRLMLLIALLVLLESIGYRNGDR